MVPHSIFLIRILPSKILEWVRVPGIRGMHPGKNYLKSSFIFYSFFTVANVCFSTTKNSKTRKKQLLEDFKPSLFYGAASAYRSTFLFRIRMEQLEGMRIADPSVVDLDPDWIQ
jgi:hypothetical protein